MQGNEKNSLVTVIIPVYNCEKYISKCIESILEQTYTTLQVIVIDDGSDDHTLDMCKKYHDERLIILHKENGGASSARNYGLRYAEGDYVLFVDSDDYLKNGAIEVLIRKSQETCADVVYFEAENVTESDDIRIRKNGFLQSSQYPMQSGTDLIPALIGNKDYHAAPFLYFIKRVLLKSELPFKEGIMFEDELFSYELLRKSKVVYCLQEKLYVRIVRHDSVMTSEGKERFRYYSIMTVFREIYRDYYAETPDQCAKVYLARIAMLAIDYHERMAAKDKVTNDDEYRSFIQMIRREKGFGKNELVARTYGKLCWFIYVLPNRIVKRIVR